jgi:TolB protein
VDQIDRTRRSTSRKVDMLTRALLCAACALVVTATPAYASFPGQNGKIAFARFTGFDDTATSDIFTMSPNGRHLVNLTPDSPGNDDFPRWSADGRKIAFWSNRTGPNNPTGDQEIFVMNADGSGLRQLTDNEVDDGGPSWSPDGDGLVFHRWLDDSNADLMTVRLDGTHERNVTNTSVVIERYGIWSPDGREIVFQRDDSGLENDIATIRPDGSHLRALTATSTDEENPDWSPDGKRIVYHTDAAMPFQQFDLHVMRSDGSSPTRLTTTTGYHAAWSPDGRKIVFVSNFMDGVELFTMRADGSSPKQRTLYPAGFDNHPDWQPLSGRARAEEDDDEQRHGPRRHRRVDARAVRVRTIRA